MRCICIYYLECHTYPIFFIFVKDGKPDMSYFAPDCFHFSTKGHMEGTKALWQNMVCEHYNSYHINI